MEDTLVHGVDADAQARTDVHMPAEADSSESTDKSLAIVDQEATEVQRSPSRPGPMRRAARGKRQHLTDVGSEVGDHTDVVEIGQPATLPEFDASAPQIPVLCTGALRSSSPRRLSWVI